MRGGIEATGAEGTTFGLHFLLPNLVRVLFRFKSTNWS